MQHQRRILFAAAAVAITILPAQVVRAETQTSVPSQAEIERLLKTRGLPTPGMPAAPPAGPLPGYAPANASTATAGSTAMQPSITFNTITFEFGSAQLSVQAIETLGNLAGALNGGLSDQKEFLIEGHTDRQGGSAYNMDLSQRRAEAVKDYLTGQLAVAAGRLRTTGKGYSEPANPANPYAAENRRVIVINLDEH